MKNKNITILYCVTEIIKKSVDLEKVSLEAAYAAAEKDPDRIETIDDWLK